METENRGRCTLCSRCRPVSQQKCVQMRKTARRDRTLLEWTFVWMVALQCFSGVEALEAHIHHSDPGGVVLTNASLGSMWSYHLQQASETAQRLVQLDSSTGLVYWRGAVPCSQIKENPLHITLLSRTWHLQLESQRNSTTIPYSVFVHGCSHSHRSWKSRRVKQTVHQLNVSVKVEHSQCIPPSTSLFHVTDFIPQSYQHCMVLVGVPSSAPVRTDHNNLIMSSVEICFVNNTFAVDASLSFMCDSTQMFHVPFQFNIRYGPYSKLNIHRRTRRAANNKPRFSSTEFTANVKEEQPAGIQVITITAADSDSEGAGTITYSMISMRDERSQNMFAINPQTGTINTTKALDREQIKAHYFLIIATDHGVPPESASASVTIIVDDINDHPPVFETNQFHIEVPENRDPGYRVVTVIATDQDALSNAEIRYSIVNPESPNDAFKIDPVKGTISTMTKLDQETRNSYRLLIQAMDQGDIRDRKSATATVDITVSDENDNKPVFSQPSYIVNLREDREPSTTVPILNITATDADTGQNAEIRYQLSGSAHDTEKFSINSVTGAMFLVGPLDYEDTREYRLTVRADDRGVNPQRETANILVQVLDVNDNAPKFIATQYEGLVKENCPVDTSIIQVQAVDSDSGQNKELTYRILSSDSNVTLPLAIDSQTGLIRTRAQIDRETQSVYNFQVIATDNGTPKLSASTSVTISVQDVNDNAPVFQLRSYDAAVSEEATIGQEVIRVLAVDDDEGVNAQVQYSIVSGNDGDAFQMNQNVNGGVITVKRKLDARQQQRYVLSVAANDNGGHRDTVQVFINVSDTNRYDPEFQSTPYQFSVDEDVAIGSSVFKVYALDRDRGENARITYSMTPGNPAFTIDPNTGDIFTRAALDRESSARYMLTVTATDNGKPQRSDTADIDIIIKDVNDNKPEFTEHVYNGEISEDALSLEKVLQISAVDRDEGANGDVSYTFEGGNDGNGDFVIDETQGIIRVAKHLDRERIASYHLVAIAHDRGTPPLSTSVEIFIKIDDVNDNHPQFESDVINVYIDENSPIGSTVAQITATDPDEGQNAVVEYSFDGGPDVDSFQLAERMGDPAIIKTMIPLDYESDKKKYEVVLRAASGTQFSTAKVFINVRDVNDNPPILKDFSIIYNNFGGSFPTSAIGRIPAFDPDVSDQELLSYQILSGNDASLLHLNTSSGQITLDPRLNSDVPRNGTFLISVSDGLNVVKATCRLSVRLVTPEMLQDSVTIRLDRMTQTAFLSSLLKFFADALASIFRTDSANIFIINIEDDTDVAPAQILNVSVSVRKGSISVQGRTQDVFYPPEYLREYIYLYRTLLANLSALQVLPFDDNLCLREPCANFAVCLSTVNSGQAKPFISSDTVMFRPIHPNNGYKCECPHGFAGMMLATDCDTEVDLCYSMPCANGGTCIPHESGYVCQCTQDFQGPNCMVNLTSKFDAVSCPQDFCKLPSVCVPLIKGGFRCSGCPDSDNFDEFCRLRTRSFKNGSYLTFPSLKKRNGFTIHLRFATLERNGLLLYNGRFNEMHDFIGLEILDSQVIFSFSLGENISRVSTYIPGGVSTGEWFPVTIQYHQRNATLTVGSGCDTNIAILYGDRLGNYSCAARVTHSLPDRCDNPIESCHRLVDLTGPLQLGGLPWAPHTGQVSQKDFIGCISDVYIDNELLDLNSSIVNILTDVGCPYKETHCQSSPCTFAGKCQEGWITFTCDCPEMRGGKDCSQEIERSRQLKGNGYLTYDKILQSVVNYPWYNGIAFRTRANSGALMQVILNIGQVRLQIVNGYIQYTYKENTLIMDSIKVNDGLWHYVEARWYPGRMEILLDYGQRQKSLGLTVSVSGSEVQLVYVGGLREANGPITENFEGCVKDIRVGNNLNALLSNPSASPNVESGCSIPSKCSPNPCGPGTCQDLWGDYECQCPPGTIKPRCENVCSMYNPCENWAECKHPSVGESTYTCECGVRQSGRYCEQMSPLTCPAAWWGDPICGPCNCDQSRGFESNCDKKNGTCKCKELHYQPSGEDKCYPCDCYPEGSVNQSCHPYTGQCSCQEGVIGRRCDQCDSIFAEINLKTHKCQVMSYDKCPRSYARGIWWDPIDFGEMAIQDCPSGSSGSAKRKCTEEKSWLEADLFNCTSDNFTRLTQQLDDFKNGIISPYIADLAIELLKNATNTTYPLYGGDIVMTLEFIREVLDYENQQTGLGLVSQQYRDFVQQLVIALSNITSLNNQDFWPRVNEVHNGSANLLQQLEKYLVKIATVMPQAQSSPFEAVSESIVLGADWMSVYNFSGRPMPKYDNNINEGSADDFANIVLPSSLFSGRTQDSKSYFGYAIYHTLGKLIEVNADSSVKVTGRPLTVNGPMFTFVVVEQGQLRSGKLSEPVYVRLKLKDPKNTTNLQCAVWSSNGRKGIWSAADCSVSDTDCQVRSDSDACQEVYITCKCYHLSTYAIIVDLEDGSALRAAVVQVEVFTYTFVSLSLVLLFVAFFILISYKRLQCNWNSIHINLVFVVFISEMAFIIGINRTNPELFCRLVAISLHYFYMAAFSWLYVEVLHIYRLLTEKQTINYGSMKFYYLLGYVIPGIIVGLAVGLNTDGYGNDSFCWLETSQLFIWSFAGPILVIVVLNIITFMLAMEASCREKVAVSDVSSVRLGLLAAILLLLLLSITWVLGLLTVNYGITALGYVHAFFLCIQGTFLFIVYILLAHKVRLCLKSTWYRLQGKKLNLDESLKGTRSSITSRSALAYRNDMSSPEGGHRVNVGISTTSTTSSSSRYGPPRFKGEDFGRSTSSSTSGHGPSSSGYPPNTGIAPYGFNPATGEALPEEEYERESPSKPRGNDSDSDSDASADRNSLDLASSHSSDDDDEFEIGPPWDQQIPKSKAVEKAREQLEKRKKERERERLGNNNTDQQWVDSSQVDVGMDHDPPPTSRPHMSSVPPDVTLPASSERTARKVTIVPPVRSDSLQNNYTSSSNVPSEMATSGRVKVQVLTHNGSLSSDSESSDETNV
ncbi:cadherin EGF LAG seven-pass G-type receptor 2-like isoform X2 [Pomacea canaliculata]|uniref:cadherin EGF LAG seven-pass G-type receptor 2-like isoform X2 n=1 Tax=Pomacea canaliculata TaxID=400727 RepID=UPI000D73AFC3|nr:cadherin EGF LAG seven-pass G-type receptor 2-like isoform X2 [Pomacea canaliculata]